MNERIKKLSEQAANEYLLEMEPITDTLSTAKRDELAQKAKQAGIGIIPHGFSEKFAELIVRECADIATINAHQWASPGTYVLKHFGVEE